MNYFEVVILSIAISLSVFPTAMSSAVDTCFSLSRTIKIALIFAIYKGGFLAIGYWIANAFSNMLAASAFWIVFGIFLILGVKMIFQSLQISPNERAFRLNNSLILIFSGIAVNIDALIAGLGFGFSIINLGYTVMIIAIATFLVTIIGAWYGKNNGNLMIASKVELTGGIILIGYAVFLLIQNYNGLV